MHPPHMGLFSWVSISNAYPKQRLFLRMDVIGTFTTRDVFVAVESATFSRCTESLISTGRPVVLDE